DSKRKTHNHASEIWTHKPLHSREIVSDKYIVVVKPVQPENFTHACLFLSEKFQRTTNFSIRLFLKQQEWIGLGSTPQRLFEPLWKRLRIRNHMGNFKAFSCKGKIGQRVIKKYVLTYLEPIF